MGLLEPAKSGPQERTEMCSWWLLVNGNIPSPGDLLNPKSWCLPEAVWDLDIQMDFRVQGRTE